MIPVFHRTALLIACLGCGIIEGAPADDRPVLELRELAAFQLPDGFRPAGAEIGLDGRVIVWDADNPRALLLDSAWQQSVDVPLDVGAASSPVLHVHRASDAVEVLTSAGIIRTVGGRSEWIVSAQTHSTIFHAGTYLDGRWVVLAQDNSERMSVLSFAGPGVNNLIRQDAPVWAASRPALFPVGNDLAILVERDSPFRSIMVDPALQMATLPSSIDHIVDALGVDRFQITGVFGVAGRLLQIAADPRSDWRALLLMDNDGRVLRSRAVNAPFGLLATSSEGHRAVGMRGGINEVVLYEISATRHTAEVAAS